jgi:hypothetical protein
LSALLKLFVEFIGEVGFLEELHRFMIFDPYEFFKREVSRTSSASPPSFPCIDSFPISLDGVYYYPNENRVCCYLTGSNVALFPRNLVCVEGCVFTVQESELIPIGIDQYNDVVSVCFPANIDISRSVGHCMCSLLCTVIFESGSRLSRITSDSFGKYLSAHSLCIPATVEVICRSSFFECSELFVLTFERGSRLSRIEREAFLECSGPSAISFPAALAELEGFALIGSNLKYISVADENVHFRTSGDFLLDFAGVSLIFCFGDNAHVTIPNWLESLGFACFGGCNFISSVIFESGCTISRLEDSAFCSCWQLFSICIPFTVEIIGENCFEDCKKLSTVTFDSGSRLSRIERGAFQWCSSLSSIDLPVNLSFLGNFAFAWTGLRNICIAEGNRSFSIDENFLSDSEGTSLVRYVGQRRDVRIANRIETIAPGCFAACSGLWTVTFENGSKLSRLERRLFGDCSSLLGICVPASVQRIRKHCFADCKMLATVSFEAESQLSRIEASAFSRCSSLSSICLPSAVELIDEDCFTGCEKLAAVTVESGSRLRRIDKHAFQFCQKLSLLRVPSSAEMGGNCWCGCRRVANLRVDSDCDSSPAVASL